MKKIKVLSIVLLSSLLIGCGINEIATTSGVVTTSDFGSAFFKSTDSLYNDEEISDTSSYEYNDTSSSSQADLIKETAMIIRDASLSVKVSSLEDFNTSLIKEVDKYDGYFERSEINNFEYDYQEERYAYFTIRLPQDHLDDFLDTLDKSATITSKSITSEDVSLEYIDVKAKLSALETEKESLENLLENATTVSEIIEINDRLTDVQHELDSTTGQKNYLESRVSYSTITITASQSRTLEHPFIDKLQLNFGQRFLDGLSTAINILTTVIVSLPVIIVVVFLGFIAFAILRKIFKKFFKK